MAYDRAAETLGNIVHLEHVNTRVPDQRLATLFYVSGLGLTRDPYLMTGVENMWVNVGRSQFHLPSGAPQRLRGVTGLVIPDRAALRARLEAVASHLAGTAFAVQETATYLEAVSPWGNRIRCHEPSPAFGAVQLGMAYVALLVPQGITAGIAAFYREILGALAQSGDDEEGAFARVRVGADQTLLFRETDQPLDPFDGHHIQIYINDFGTPYQRLRERGLITEESDQHQYRFETLVDPQSAAPLFTLEHEVRSLRHPLYARDLVNRNPAQSNLRYAPGRDALPWSLPVA
jgi:catechol 2,3-dioxygenase-like lactoylglutathione lyase family enzyme